MTRDALTKATGEEAANLPADAEARLALLRDNLAELDDRREIPAERKPETRSTAGRTQTREQPEAQQLIADSLWLAALDAVDRPTT